MQLIPPTEVAHHAIRLSADREPRILAQDLSLDLVACCEGNTGGVSLPDSSCSQYAVIYVRPVELPEGYGAQAKVSTAKQVQLPAWIDEVDAG